MSTAVFLTLLVHHLSPWATTLMMFSIEVPAFLTTMACLASGAHRRLAPSVLVVILMMMLAP